ncbi:platelet glycoprotein Ib alpha chain [Scophthalmus maximus]|uniref:platelet glycoprotein Ib alpha chain n=1 Tax=Scophthalmus maximus TaxID=52904 RepID=UPI001FA8FCE3|nr:platelet glycoprotein Ib alpha chain [Scophthalmus maximus]
MQLFLLLLLLLSHIAMVTAVAGCPSDRDKDHRSRVNCTAAGFSEVPAGVEPTTKVLLFPRNLFSSLSWSSFQMFEDLYEIDLTGNKVPEVTPSGAPILPTLSVLRLGSNRLTSLSVGSFSACPSLTELYLDKNNIDTLSNHTFSGLSKLEILDLSSNRIKELPELMLHPVPAIETLYLEINKIKVMPENWFSRKEEVPYLYLSANPWACSCSLDYFHRYLNEYELNVYVRDGPIIRGTAESVVCDSPQRLRGKPVMLLEETDLCPNEEDEGSPVTESPYKRTPAAAATTIATTVVTFPPRYHRLDGPVLSSHDSVTQTFLATESASYMTTAAPTKPWTTRSVPSTVTSTTPTPQVVSTPSTTPTPQVVSTPSTTPPPQVVSTPARPVPSWVLDRAEDRGTIGAFGAAGVFCFWLLAACGLLCVGSAACILATVARLVVWYSAVYKPLSAALARRGGGGEGVRLLTYGRGVRGEVAGAGGVMALYRSVLFIHREEGGDMEREDGVTEGEGVGGGGGKDRLLVALEPTGSEEVKRGEEGKGGGTVEKGVYRKTLYHLLSKEEAITGWRDVMEEECRVSAEDGVTRAAGGGGGVSKKRYSVVLREERGEAGGGSEEVEWVVGGWEIKGGGEGGRVEEPRSSWGEWLAHYLPSMPWGVTMPPDREAAQ